MLLVETCLVVYYCLELTKVSLFDMKRQGLVVLEFFVTVLHLALKPFRLSVNEQMHLQVAAAGELLGTLVAFVGLFVGVDALMSLQITRLCKTFIASGVLARELSGVGVGELVFGVRMVLLVKLVTFRGLVLELVHMGSLMSLKLTQLVKDFITTSLIALKQHEF